MIISCFSNGFLCYEMRILAFAFFFPTAGKHVCPQHRADACDESPDRKTIWGEEKRVGGERETGPRKHPGPV